mgnify:CR=1 FL=1
MLTLLTFTIQDVLFGIEINYVREINRNVEFTVVPGASDDVVGLFNMRGNVVVLFNLAYKFGYENKDITQGSTCIVLKAIGTGQDSIGFIIDKTGDVLTIDEELCETLPANVTDIEQKYFKSVIKLEKELLMLIDPQKVFNI